MDAGAEELQLRDAAQPQAQNRENVRSMDHEFYRHGLDSISDCQITWDPYTPNLIAGLPAICTFGSTVWLSRTPLICFQIVEMHVPDRVLLQFGMLQHIPDPVEAIERVTMQGKAEKDWPTYHDKYIMQWQNRLLTVVKQQDTGNSDPTHARNCYLEWYWQITRRWISTPVECPIISYELSGHTDKVLVDLVSTVQGRIRTLLQSEIGAKRMKESLIDIDVYITVKMAEAKQVALIPCPNESSYLNCKRQHMLMSSIVVQIMQSGVPTGMGIRSAKPAMICSNNVDPTQVTVAKMEQVGDDHVEGNTILQLDQMRRIQPTGETADLAPLTTGDTTGNKTEDVHPQEDPLDITMTEVNLQDIISTPVEDAMTDIMNTSAEDATLDDISDSEVKNDYASIETVEVQEPVGSIDNIKIYKKFTAELQECTGAPLINGKVDEVISVFMYNEFYKIVGVSSNNEKLQKFTGASENDGINEEIVETRSENSTGQGTLGRPFSTGPEYTLNTSVKKLSSLPGDGESPSVPEQEEPDAAFPGRVELQDAVQTQPEDNVVLDGVDAVQNHIFRENAKDPIENGPCQKPVAIPAEDLLISRAGEITQRSVNAFTGEANDTIGREKSTGDEDLGNPGPNEVSKRRKLTNPSHGNSEYHLTVEATKMGTANTEEKTDQDVRSGGGQLIAFTRRKRKH
ncbi:Serine/threonine-protein phosphatase 7 long form-like protein [Dichanthelium oligosanthes]|uniref:Serine/threonine-protein phosphatase 7 long form-like protein n=1 Tax=Dichanthelium oligosanthes TaxID=888268 RepID=A0A1E5V703_9POAL|nr:Serine/threonine-protein phosphatase 7 long form-like protein [Dichanthelium oligosanthes]